MSSKSESKSGIEENNTNEGIIVPKWLDTQFLEKNLQEYYNDQHIAVVKFDINPGVGKRENFNSSLYRLNVTIVKNDRKTPKSEENKVYWIVINLDMIVTPLNCNSIELFPRNGT